jgi:3',5'-nucleoside bisphosphate phosphatase
MKWYKADLHIHTVLSPCGDLEMSPVKIIEKALEMNLSLLGITDHNSTRHCSLTMELGSRNGITVIPGAEVTTQEEIHCLALFEDIDAAGEFQKFIDTSLITIRNRPDVFGHQLLVDEAENITDEEERLLIVGLDAGIEEVENKVHELGGIFIPAHIDRPGNSLMSQLGFIPENLKFDAIEISKAVAPEILMKEYAIPDTYTLIRNSDAHYLHQIGSNLCMYYLEKPDFSEFRMALNGAGGRKIHME